ncbi:hypothetical protein GGX14DRAFT_608718 [Mycena pura]|uniref:Uncharacterized protein n=1 Tax=Mycena pura TaxID=153505 RepID=A0AAD6UMF5_9AGAR|nr:hypothetical protein GGX14DRAFT_608718 [Mycena pura]
MSHQSERPYTEQDLVGNKNYLIKLVQRQQARWPGDKFQPSKVTVANLKSALLDPIYGFTTNKPPVTSPHPSKSDSRSSVNLGGSQTVIINNPQSPDPIEFVHAPSLGAMEFVSVRAYIEDCRFNPAQRTQARLSIPLLDRKGSSLGSFRVHSSQLFAALQRGNSAIEVLAGSGVVRVSFADPEEEDWKIPFVRVHHGQPIDELDFSPDVLELPENGCIKLFVDSTGILATTVVKSEVVPLPGSHDGPSTVSRAEAGAEEITDPAVKYLREKLATRDGYEAFAARRGHVRSNPDAVLDWQFAVDFTRDYNRIKSPVKVSKDTICRALGIGSSWPVNAHTATGIIGTYGKVQEVEEMLMRIDDPLPGATALLGFLVEWKKDHPV